MVVSGRNQTGEGMDRDGDRDGDGVGGVRGGRRRVEGGRGEEGIVRVGENWDRNWGIKDT